MGLVVVVILALLIGSSQQSQWYSWFSQFMSHMFEVEYVTAFLLEYLAQKTVFAIAVTDLLCRGQCQSETWLVKMQRDDQQHYLNTVNDLNVILDENGVPDEVELQPSIDSSVLEAASASTGGQSFEIARFASHSQRNRP